VYSGVGGYTIARALEVRGESCLPGTQRGVCAVKTPQLGVFFNGIFFFYPTELNVLCHVFSQHQEELLRSEKKQKYSNVS
jgi:hypothetical protein